MTLKIRLKFCTELVHFLKDMFYSTLFIIRLAKKDNIDNNNKLLKN